MSNLVVPIILRPRLLSLPAEIRRMIWEWVLGGHELQIATCRDPSTPLSFYTGTTAPEIHFAITDHLGRSPPYSPHPSHLFLRAATPLPPGWMPVRRRPIEFDSRDPPDDIDVRNFVARHCRDSESISTSFPLTLLRVNRVIWSEASEVLFHENCFHFSGVKEFGDFLRMIGPIQRQMLRSIRLSSGQEILDGSLHRKQEWNRFFQAFSNEGWHLPGLRELHIQWDFMYAPQCLWKVSSWMLSIDRWATVKLNSKGSKIRFLNLSANVETWGTWLREPLILTPSLMYFGDSADLLRREHDTARAINLARSSQASIFVLERNIAHRYGEHESHLRARLYETICAYYGIELPLHQILLESFPYYRYYVPVILAGG